ncbi:MAG: hypothetical protein J0M12_17495, partial [Deltaproteobacteria bacterium]|nr:hypothetical protein [Deltaproteobacteria bacterium]
MVTACAVLFSLFIAWFLIRPHLATEYPVPHSAASPEVGILLDRRERSLQVLKDLELDYQTKKITEADYQAMRRSLSQELATVLSSID